MFTPFVVVIIVYGALRNTTDNDQLKTTPKTSLSIAFPKVLVPTIVLLLPLKYTASIRAHMQMNQRSFALLASRTLPPAGEGL